jgi:hypothetical protein
MPILIRLTDSAQSSQYRIVLLMVLAMAERVKRRPRATGERYQSPLSITLFMLNVLEEKRPGMWTQLTNTRPETEAPQAPKEDVRLHLVRVSFPWFVFRTIVPRCSVHVIQ